MYIALQRCISFDFYLSLVFFDILQMSSDSLVDRTVYIGLGSHVTPPNHSAILSRLRGCLGDLAQ